MKIKIPIMVDSSARMSNLFSIGCFNVDFLVATTTTIDAGPDIYVSIGSKLELTCRVYTAGIKLNYLIWRRGDKVLSVFMFFTKVVTSNI